MLVARATLVGEAATLALLGDLGATDMQIARLIEEGAVVKDGQRYGLVEGWEETL